MPCYMYVALQEDDKISVFTIDPDTGGMTLQADVAVPGGPFTLAVSPDKRFLYAGCRDVPQLNSYAIDPSGGGLTQNGTVALGGQSHVRRHRPPGPVRPVGLLPGGPCGGASHRGRRFRGRGAHRVAGNGH